MKSLFAIFLTLALTPAFSAEEEFKVVDLPVKDAFYRELPKGDNDLLTEVKTFLRSAETYKIANSDEWIVLEIDVETKKVTGLAMELETSKSKHVPAGRRKPIAGGKFIHSTINKKHRPEDVEKRMKKFMAEKKLKRRGNYTYMLMPIQKKPNEEIPGQNFTPVE